MRYYSLLLFTFTLLAHGAAFSNDHHPLSLRGIRSRLPHHVDHAPVRRSRTRSKSQASAGAAKRCSAPTPPQANPPKNNALLNVQSNCGAIGATSSITATSGPNGSEDWLNCGINDGGGWRPPYVTVDNLITEDLSTAITTPGSPFDACKPYVHLFTQYGQMNGLPSILLASIALQESGCNPDVTGGAGEQGLMQLTTDKCDGAPGGNCKDPDFNVKTGAKYFSDTLANNGGNVLQTIGMYNGWKYGLTHVLISNYLFEAGALGGAVDEAVAAASGSCCRCQNNLDYLHQTLNGWMQNVNPYNNNPRLGKYFNLDQCGN